MAFERIRYLVQDEKKELKKKIVTATPRQDMKGAIGEFSFSNIRPEEAYDDLKVKVGPLAVTDQDRESRDVRDNRFVLSDLVRPALSVEAEEKRVFHEALQRQLDALSDETRAKGFDEGFRVGFQEGLEKSFAQVREESASEIERFEHFIQSFETMKVDMMRENESFLMRIIAKMTRMVLLREIKLDETYLLRLMQELVGRLGVRENITIEISSADFKNAQKFKTDLVEAIGQLQNLRIVEEPSIAMSGCRVVTKWNNIDATIERQLSAIEEQFFSMYRKDDHANE